MKALKGFAATLVVFVSACSSTPSSPTGGSAVRVSTTEVSEGSSTSATITSTRLRLRRVGEGDIMTVLQNGQVISVPRSVRLDIWAEIARLESDRARLLVDWGNGNVDHTGCGSCRLENVYEREGRYEVVAKVIDINAPDGGGAVTSVSFVIDVVAPPSPCNSSSVAVDFETPWAPGSNTLFAPGVTVDGLGLQVGPVMNYQPMVIGKAAIGLKPMTFTFDSEKNYMRLGVSQGSDVTGTMSYVAYDAQGRAVFDGVVTIDTPGPFVGSSSKGWFEISGGPFRSVVVTYDVTLYSTLYDNLYAACTTGAK